MFLKPIFLVLLTVTTSQNFEIVSTTEKQHQASQSVCHALKETNDRLLAIENQNSQFQKFLDQQYKLNENTLSQLKDVTAKLANSGPGTTLANILNSKKTCDFEKVTQAVNLQLQGISETIRRRVDDALSSQQAAMEKLQKFLDDNENTQLGAIDNMLKSKTSCSCQLGQEEIKLQLEAIGKKIDDAFSGKLRVTAPTDQPQKVNQNQKLHLPSYCKTVTDENNWTYVLRKIDGSQDFNLYWNDYKKGFGDLNGEFWMGLECLYQLTNSEDYELMVKLVGPLKDPFYASYERFKIGPEEEGYPLEVLEGFSGDADDGLSPLLNMKFTTRDNDHDNAYSNCAHYHKGGWWFDNCYIGAGFLTGARKDIFWRSKYYRIPKAEMMVRPTRR